jgi:hypothetical protein
MDELLIGDKKYISSKRAAKVTGYAKDYIGQLCREGRVPARLVGRSWYVLESALHDHRFGQKVEEERPAASSIFSSTWEEPRYEASPTEVLPSKIEEEPLVEAASAEAVEQGATLSDVSEHLQDAWKAWFERVGQEEVHVPAKQEEVLPEPEERPEAPAEEISVPIRAIYKEPPKELLPRSTVAQAISVRSVATEDAPREKGNRGGYLRVFRFAGASFALAAVTLAALGSGYFDSYLLSNKQVSMMAGVIVHNK